MKNRISLKSNLHFLLTVLLITFVSLLSKAQVSGLELSAGGRMTTLDGNNLRLNQLSSLGEDNRLGGDVFSKIHINLGANWIKIAPEVFFIQNGTQETHNNVGTVSQNLINGKIRMNYSGISIPLAINIPIKKNGNTYAIELYGSGFADYAVSGSYTDLNGKKTDLSFGEGTTDRMDWGISTGLGFMVNGLVIRAGYDKGLKEIEFVGASTNGQPSPTNVKNTGFFATIGFMTTIN